MADENAGTTGVEELRAQFDALQRRIAIATVGAQEDFVALLASPEVDGLMAAMTSAAADLDEATRKRVAAWVKMRSDIASLAKSELVRLRGLAAVADQGEVNGG
ncbi:hypothetical protein JQK15_04000 [Sphingobium sp. BHU LFT2]|uniref:hypothetical protein n=1 Tax=Sphingobium sp. BHU LFT2 TaxID=2807634 RepID=UPI001BE7ADCB|nr:hypothetical protein [Sphingobium sp. BHU LFT2]MBT2242692.1 hypothetical protein [Sphingobium sp. BHU LFT2]